MLIVTALAAAALVFLVLLVLLRWHRSAAVARTDAADLAPHGQELPDQELREQEPELHLPGHADADLPDSMLVRVLRAQVRTLEQALERSDEATVLAEPREATAAQAEPAQAVALVARAPAEVAQVRQVPLVLPAAEHDRMALPSEPDVVLPVPPLALPDGRRSHRWFRRSAA